MAPLAEGRLGVAEGGITCGAFVTGALMWPSNTSHGQRPKWNFAGLVCGPDRCIEGRVLGGEWSDARLVPLPFPALGYRTMPFMHSIIIHIIFFLHFFCIFIPMPHVRLLLHLYKMKRKGVGRGVDWQASSKNTSLGRKKGWKDVILVACKPLPIVPMPSEQYWNCRYGSIFMPANCKPWALNALQFWLGDVCSDAFMVIGGFDI